MVFVYLYNSVTHTHTTQCVCHQKMSLYWVDICTDTRINYINTWAQICKPSLTKIEKKWIYWINQQIMSVSECLLIQGSQNEKPYFIFIFFAMSASKVIFMAKAKYKSYINKTKTTHTQKYSSLPSFEIQ